MNLNKTTNGTISKIFMFISFMLISSTFTFSIFISPFLATNEKKSIVIQKQARKRRQSESNYSSYLSNQSTRKKEKEIFNRK